MDYTAVATLFLAFVILLPASATVWLAKISSDNIKIAKNVVQEGRFLKEMESVAASFYRCGGKYQLQQSQHRRANVSSS
jgi:hypothetical protein